MAKETNIPYIITLRDEATKVYNQFAKGVQKESKGIEDTVKSIGGAIGAAFSVYAIQDFMKKSADAEAQTALLAQALSNSGNAGAEATQAFLEQADALKKKTATDDDEIKRIQTLTVGMTGNAAAAYKLTPVILDLARGMGISSEAAAKMFSKSLEGSEGLKKAGIVIGETSSETERLGAISAAVTKKFGGMAAAFAQTDAGKIKAVSIAVEDLEKGVGKVFLGILGPSLPGIIKLIDGLAWAFEKSVLAIKVVATTVITAIIVPFAVIERAMNAMGITSSTVLQNFVKSGMNQVTDASQKLTNGFSSTNKTLEATGFKAKETTKEFVSMKDKIKNLQTELDKLTPGTAAYNAKLFQLTVEQNKYKRAVEESEKAVILMMHAHDPQRTMKPLGLAISKTTTEIKTMKLAYVDVSAASDEYYANEEKNQAELENKLQQYKSLAFDVFASVGAALGNMFTGQDEDAKQVLKSLAGQFITLAESAMFAATAIATAKDIASFWTSMIKDGPLLLAGFAALETARAVINKFHDGGTVGAFGERIPLRSDERPAIVKVGETIRTREQEARVQNGGGTVINLNFNHPVEGAEFIRSGIGKIMRSLGVENISEIKFNQRSNLAIS